MAPIFIASKPITLSSKQAIGKGGEADIFDLGSGVALKLYKQPVHPDFQVADPAERAALQSAAVARLAIHQSKLRVFPRHLPSNVLGPVELAYDKPGGSIVGFTMPYLHDAEMLFQYGRQPFRDALAVGMGNNDFMRDILLDLHSTLRKVHAAGAVIGDFNDLNVLVKDSEVFLVDADSFQYGGFLCNTFQYRFVDPLLCDPTLPRPELRKPHSEYSDWYAFTAMVMRCLLYVEPYGGIYRPQNGSDKVQDSARPLHRLSIFHPQVQYPRPAIPLQSLPDDALQYLFEVLVNDRRGEFPLPVLENLRWTTCLQCGSSHARAVCPYCHPCSSLSLSRQPLPEPSIVEGIASWAPLFNCTGTIVQAQVLDGKLCWVYEQDGALLREDGSPVVRGNLLPGMSVLLSKGETHLARNGRIVTISNGDSTERRAGDTGGSSPSLGANAVQLYWLADGHLYRSGDFGPLLIGDVLAHRTRFWVGEQFGFGFYQAGALSGTFVFDALKVGIKDQLSVSLPAGQLLHADCLFGDGVCWLLISVQERGHVMNHCLLISRGGEVLGRHVEEDGTASWLGSLAGKCATGTTLFAATDNGIVHIELLGDRLVQTESFTDTAPYVNSESRLLAATDGFYVITQHGIHLLKIVHK
ncbi:MAG: hypothetical protein ABI670_00880 [Chloroflexota bacterium]